MVVNSYCMLLTVTFLSATMTKIIKEMLPPDVRVARDAQDLLIECCVGKLIMDFHDFIVIPSSLFMSSINQMQLSLLDKHLILQWDFDCYLSHYPFGM